MAITTPPSGVFLLTSTSEAKKKVDATGSFISSAALVGDLILAPNADHNLYAYDKDLTLKWKFSASNGLWTKPVSDGDLIYVTSMDKSVYALKENAKKDGVDVLWSKDLGGSILFSLAIGKDGNLYIGTLNNELFSIEAKSGKSKLAGENGRNGLVTCSSER